MTKKLPILFLLCIPAFSMAQVSLNSSMAPPLNSMMIYYDANVPSPAFVFSTSGTSNTWDFSGMFASQSDDDTLFIVDPASVPLSSSFPAATHCTYEGGDANYTMIHIDAGGVSYLGNVSDISGSGTYYPLVFVPSLQAMTFPYTYGSTANASGYFELFQTGAAIGQPNIDSVHYKSYISGQIEVIASGNMIIPSGTMPAMLERNISSNVDTLWIKGAPTGNQWIISSGFPQSSLDSSFYWYTNNSIEPYAHALYDDTGLHDVNFFKGLLTGITETVNNFNVVAYPNPSTGILNFSLPSITGICDFKVFNSTGQLIMNGKLNISQLNISYLPSGYYSMQLTSSEGKLSNFTFVKQ